MSKDVTTARITVDGMSCATCERRIEKAVSALEGVQHVVASASLADLVVRYDSKRTSLAAIHRAVADAGYHVREETVSAPDRVSGIGVTAPRGNRATLWYRILGVGVMLAAVYLILRYSSAFTFLPTVDQSMGYGLIFVVGLLTSLHCIAMCGGIVLSQGVKNREGEEPGRPAPAHGARIMSGLVPSLLYNFGRVISYTVVGGLVGALGSVLSLSMALKGVMPILAGLFMLFLGVRMLGVFPWLSRLKIRLPGFGGRKLTDAASRKGPMVVGLLNGLMPCGPLQTMQVYALGTGSLLGGALSMFLFSIGTVPLLLGFGALSALLSVKFNRRMVKVSAVLVMVLGFVMFSRGMSLFGIALPSIPRGAASSLAIARVSSGYQEVRTSVTSGGYSPFIVQKGIPVRWTISVKAEDLNGCNNPVTVPQYGIQKLLEPGDNLIEFTPKENGTVVYTCWMGMISSTFRVVEDVAKLTPEDRITPPAGDIAAGLAGGGGSCCSGPASGRFAGGQIPVDIILVATRTAEGQIAEVRVNDDGYTPAVVVVQRGVKAKIRFSVEQLTSCNYIVSFPDYRGSLDLRTSGTETPYLNVVDDFTFECGMGMLHGYVKVVDDIGRVDLKAVAEEGSAYRSPAGSGGCGG